MIERKNPRRARIATFAVVHEIYFEQFPGLEENLNKYHNDFTKKLLNNGVEVVDFGIVGNNTTAFEVAEKINGSSVDLIMCIGNMIHANGATCNRPKIRFIIGGVLCLGKIRLSFADHAVANSIFFLAVKQFHGHCHAMCG